MIRLIATAAILAFTGINTWLFTHKEELMNLEPIVIETAQEEFKVYAELATTTQEKSQGLMHREKLKEDRGMLFIYEKPRQVSFWMKNMLISIDMIFIGEDLEIKHIAKSAPPCAPETKCTHYRPPVPVQYILEVPSGYTEERQIKIGDKITMDLTD